MVDLFKISLLELLSEAYTGPTHAYTWFIGNEPGSGILGTLEAARALVAATEHAELFLYPGNQHYFADSSLPSYDATAAALLTERVLEFLGNC